MGSSHHEQNLTFVDLFCGAGGLSLGFQRVGFKCVCAIDNNESAIETYRHNFQDHVVCADINENTPLPNADVIIGGPPCQGFSSAGMRLSNDERNSLVRVFSKLVTRQKPTAFVFENVEGFFTADKGNRVFDLIEPLIESGYRVHLRKINAANYGVPQHRKRVIVIGGLGWNPTFPEPTHRASGAPGSSRVFKHLPPCPNLSDALAILPPLMDNTPIGFSSGHYSRTISERDIERIRLLQPGCTMKDLPNELWHDSYRRRAYRRVMDGTPTERRGGPPAGLRRLNSDQPSKTITGGAISEFVHPTENRYLTLRECATIQTFPCDFTFFGTSSKIIIQIGNAVPPRLAEIIASNLKNDLMLNKHSRSHSEGALLSFKATNSTGKSPALERVCRQVEGKFLIQRLDIKMEGL